MIDALSTSPAIQWISSHANLMPRIGTNAVNNSVSMLAAMTQWNIRAPSEWRLTLSGTRAATGSVSGGATAFGLGTIATYSVCAIMNSTPRTIETYTRFHWAWVRTSSLQGLRPHCTK